MTRPGSAVSLAMWRDIINKQGKLFYVSKLFLYSTDLADGYGSGTIDRMSVVVMLRVRFRVLKRGYALLLATLQDKIPGNKFTAH